MRLSWTCSGDFCGSLIHWSDSDTLKWFTIKLRFMCSGFMVWQKACKPVKKLISIKFTPLMDTGTCILKWWGCYAHPGRWPQLAMPSGSAEPTESASLWSECQQVRHLHFSVVRTRPPSEPQKQQTSCKEKGIVISYNQMKKKYLLYFY